MGLKIHRRRRNRKNDSDSEFPLTFWQEFIKVKTAADMIDNTKGVNTFPCFNIGSEHSCVIFDSLGQIMGIQARDEQLAFLNRRVTIGRTSNQIIGMHLDRASGRFHDTVVSKILATSFAGLPAPNMLSSSTRKEKSSI